MLDIVNAVCQKSTISRPHCGYDWSEKHIPLRAHYLFPWSFLFCCRLIVNPYAYIDSKRYTIVNIAENGRLRLSFFTAHFRTEHAHIQMIKEKQSRLKRPETEQMFAGTATKCRKETDHSRQWPFSALICVCAKLRINLLDYISYISHT